MGPKHNEIAIILYLIFTHAWESCVPHALQRIILQGLCSDLS